MIELIIGTYGFTCWLVFKKLKLIKVTTYSVVTAILIGIVLLSGILLLLMMYHPATKDARFYAFTTPIVPQVRGQVTTVTLEGKGLKKGDALFQIDPQPFQFDVDRLEAALANAKSNAAQLKERLDAAVASTQQAQADYKAAESDLQQQTAEDLNRAKATLERATAQFQFTATELERQRQLLASKVISQAEYDQSKRAYDTAVAQVKEAEAAERQASEKVKSSTDRLRSVKEQLTQAEAREREARVAHEAESEGVNPQVRQIMAELEEKKWELAQTTVRAPADGYVTQNMLRPGQMVVPMPLSPVMVFVHDEDAILAGSFPQNVIANLEPGLDVELAFKSHPGQIFKAKVRQVLPIIPEGQLQAMGQLRALAAASAPGRIPVIFDYGEDVKGLNLPGGSQAMAAIYTHHVHAMSIVRKILLRMKSWENYVFTP